MSKDEEGDVLFTRQQAYWLRTTGTIIVVSKDDQVVVPVKRGA